MLSNIVGHDGHGGHAMGGHSRWDAFRGRSRAASSRKKDCADHDWEYRRAVVKGSWEAILPSYE